MDGGKEKQRRKGRKETVCCGQVRECRGGDVTVTLATPTHILQPLPQAKKIMFFCNIQLLQIIDQPMQHQKLSTECKMCAVYQASRRTKSPAYYMLITCL